MFYNKQKNLRPVKAYVIAALVINLLSNVSWVFKERYHFPVVLQVNTYMYSIHSIVRFFLFWLFFCQFNLPFNVLFRKIIPAVFIVFLVINFSYEPFIYYWYKKGELKSTISHRLLSLEACLMLFYCLAYYISRLKDDSPETGRNPDFWIISGLCIFSMCSFPIYLFYQVILKEYLTFTINIWDIQKLAFLIFCICMAKGFTLKNTTSEFVASNK